MTTIWVDDIRIPRGDYIWAKSTNEAIGLIQKCEKRLKRSGLVPSSENITVDLDHDAGAFYSDGGDFIRVLDWMEATGRDYSIRIHTMNPVGRMNMMNIVEKNNWRLLR